MSVRILLGDVREQLRTLPDRYFDCAVFSPPYWGLRDYGVAGQIGLEPTLGEHLATMVGVMREIRRVLKDRGTVWLNYGDCYAASPNGKSAAAYKADGTDDRTFRDKPFSTVGPVFDPAYARTLRVGTSNNRGNASSDHGGRIVAGGYLKPKDLCMIPNRLAIALQDDGWWVRSEIIWHKPNPMPESVYDRPTSAHEKIWLLSKSEDYFYNHEAIREPVKAAPRASGPASREALDRVPVSRKVKVPGGWDVQPGAHGTINRSGRTEATYTAAPVGRSETRNARNVWTIAPKAYREAHFATFPPALAERCIKAGVPAQACGLCGHALPHPTCEGLCRFTAPVPGRVLDPFGGAGTVGLVADQLGLDATLIELNPDYAAMAARRIGPAAEIVGGTAVLAVAAE